MENGFYPGNFVTRSGNFSNGKRRDALKRTGCLDQKVVVQVTKQGGLSSTGYNEYGDNSQSGQ